MDQPNLDFFDFGLENFVVIVMVCRMGLVGKFFSYVIYIREKYGAAEFGFF